MTHHLGIERQENNRSTTRELLQEHSLLSCKPHPLQKEEGSGHAATIELSPRQELDVTNQIRTALRRLHPLSWSTITSQRV